MRFQWIPCGSPRSMCVHRMGKSHSPPTWSVANRRRTIRCLQHRAARPSLNVRVRNLPLVCADRRVLLYPLKAQRSKKRVPIYVTKRDFVYWRVYLCKHSFISLYGFVTTRTFHFFKKFIYLPQCNFTLFRICMILCKVMVTLNGKFFSW